jgi:hypothetical protein
VIQYRAPSVSGASIIDSDTILVNLVHNGSSDIDPADSAFTGFSLVGSGVAITNAQKYDADTIELTISGGTTNVTSLKYLYGKAPTVTDNVYDSTTLELPVEFKNTIYLDAEDPAVTITSPTSSSTYSAGWTISSGTLSNSGDPYPWPIGGTATDDINVDQITWACTTTSPTSGTATCTGCGTTSATWVIEDITAFSDGENLITVTVEDTAENQHQDSITTTSNYIAENTPSPAYGNGDVCTFCYQVTTRDSGSGLAYVGGYFRTIPLVNRVGYYCMDAEVIDYISPVELTTDVTNGWSGEVRNIIMERKQDN